jgi:outer membrane protein assembly factor BamA
MTRPSLAPLLVLALIGSTPASAQDTRTEALERQRAEKAGQLQPYQPTGAEKALLWVENNNPLTLLAPYNGFFIQYGYTGKPIGSGIAFGGGWRHDILDRNARVALEAGVSFRNYRMIRADLSMPYIADETFEVGVEASYRVHPQEDFYGNGFFTQKDFRTAFRYEAPGVEARAMIKPKRWWNAGVRLGYLDVEVGPGTDKRFPSIEEVFDALEVAGLLDQPSYLYGDLFATLDTRDSPGNARAGQYVGARWRRYQDQDLGRFDFDALDIDVQQFIPIFDKKRVFALRAQLMTTTAGDGHEVPFYFRPTLGGSDTLRSYADFRFRDRNVFVANVEYRWEAFSGLDMALFSDFGEAAPAFDLLDVGDLKGAYGIGLRFNTAQAVFLRFDVAAGGSEGIRTFFKFSKAF